jgi:Holliday junction DNA helicase RuvA
VIGKLKGLVEEIGEDFVVIDVGGVGYLVTCSARTLQRLSGSGEAAALSIETHVREDAIRLYGFLSAAERDWFRLLQGVQGVGAKVALSILSTLSPAELGTAIAMQDKAAIGRANGVGPKLAQRLVLELKDKAPAFAAIDAAAVRVSDGVIERKAPKPVQDAVSALVNLGYAQAQASLAVSEALKALGEGAETPALIRRGLKELSQ